MTDGIIFEPRTPEGLRFVVHKSEDRQLDDQGRIKTFKTFNGHELSNSAPSNNDSFGALRVLNECRVSASLGGFGMLNNKDYETFIYVLSGELQRRDFHGNTDILRRGDIQLSSAGADQLYRGRALGTEGTHFMQVWCHARFRAVATREYIRHFSAEEMWNRWALVVAPAHTNGTSLERSDVGPAPIQTGLALRVAALSQGNALHHTLSSRRAYIHVPQTSGFNPNTSVGACVVIQKVSDPRPSSPLQVKEGDGVYVLGRAGDRFVLENVSELVADVLLFDLD